MKKFLSVALFLITFVQANIAQESVVITSKMDTLRGKAFINFGDAYSNDAVMLKIDKKKKKLNAYEVRSVFLPKDSSILHPIKMDGRYQFIKLLQDGSFVKLYGYKTPTEANASFGYQVLIKADGGQHKLGNIGYKKGLINFLTECPKVTEKIENGTYKKNNLNKVIDQYNACISEKSNASLKEVTAVIEASKIDDLISMVNDADIEDKAELLDMLTDVKGKMASQKEIPSYLQNAIIEKFDNKTEFVNTFKSIIKNK